MKEGEKQLVGGLASKKSPTRRRVHFPPPGRVELKHHRAVAPVQGQVTVFSPGHSLRRRAAQKGPNLSVTIGEGLLVDITWSDTRSLHVTGT